MLNLSASQNREAGVFRAFFARSARASLQVVAGLFAFVPVAHELIAFHAEPEYIPCQSVRHDCGSGPACHVAPLLPCYCYDTKTGEFCDCCGY